MSAKTEPEILVVAPEVPAFDRASGSLRLYQMLRILARRYRVAFLGRMDVTEPRSSRYARALEEVGIALHPAPDVDVSDALGQVDLCVLFEFFTTAERNLGRVRRRRPDLPVIVDSVDVHFLRELRGARYSRLPRLARLRAVMTRRRELRTYSRADLILAVSEADRSEILRRLPRARVAVIPNVHVVREVVPHFDERPRNSLVFVGGFAHLPNVDAMLFFCRDVFPLIQRVLPDARLTIVGGDPPPEVRRLAGRNIAVSGWVPEVRPYLDSHCIGIAPLRFGAGMKGKIGEALAEGLPMVTTSIGAEGMGLEDEKTAMIADSPEKFARAVVRVCTEPALHRQLSEGGRMHVRQRWDLATVGGELIAAVESLRDCRPRPMSRRERIEALMAEAYGQSGLPALATRLVRTTEWYASRVTRTLNRR